LKDPSNHPQALSTAECLVCFLSLRLLAWDRRGLRSAGAGSGFGVAKDSNPFIDPFFKFVFVDESFDLQGTEEVSDVFARPCARLSNLI
jgi:hypothetical protein